MIGVLLRGNCYVKTDTTGEGRVMTEAKTEVLQLQAKERLGLLEAGRGKEGSSSRLQREDRPANILISDFPSTVRVRSCCFKYQVCGISLL